MSNPNGMVWNGIVYGSNKANLNGGCPLSSCHTFDGTFPPMRPLYMTNVRMALPMFVLGALSMIPQSAGSTLFHYTNEEGLAGILESGELRASTKAANPNDVRYGDGQYLTDIAPGTRTRAQLSRAFIGQPFQGQKFTHFIEIDMEGLNAFRGRESVFVVPGVTPLSLRGRIVRYGGW
jgi:hypothetical protein